MSESPLSQDQIDQYWRDGYTVVPGLIPDSDLAVYDQRFEDIVLGKVERNDRMLVMKDVMVAKGAIDPKDPLERIQKVQDFELDPVLDTYCHHPKILECVEGLIGEGVMTIHNMLINKPPNVDGRHPLHQDLLYFPFRPADKIVASWTAMTRMTKENGCLVVVPGSQKGELMEHENPEWEHLNGGYFGVKDVAGRIEHRAHLELEPGDTVFFHPIILHGSGRNRTQNFRRAISAHYARNDCEWIWEVEDMDNRYFRIVTGPDKGKSWTGAYNKKTGANDPIDLIPAENILEGNVRARRDSERGPR